MDNDTQYKPFDPFEDSKKKPETKDNSEDNMDAQKRALKAIRDAFK